MQIDIFSVQNVISYGLILANIFFFGTAAYYNMKRCYKNRTIKIVCTLIWLNAAYWTVIYIYVLLSDIGIFPPRGEYWSITWIRPALTFTACLMALMGRYTRTSNEL